MTDTPHRHLCNTAANLIRSNTPLTANQLQHLADSIRPTNPDTWNLNATNTYTTLTQARNILLAALCDDPGWAAAQLQHLAAKTDAMKQLWGPNECA